MRAVFLDIDGVIATPTSVRLNYLLGRGPERQWYDPVSLCYLGRLVAETNATVVLASNWRSALTYDDPFMASVMHNLLDQLADAGAPVTDTTPLLNTGDRSTEIGHWLARHDCDAWVIIDDLACFDDRPDVVEGHLVIIDDSCGIRHQHYQRARAMLLSRHEVRRMAGRPSV